MVTFFGGGAVILMCVDLNQPVCHGSACFQVKQIEFWKKTYILGKVQRSTKLKCSQFEEISPLILYQYQTKTIICNGS